MNDVQLAERFINSFNMRTNRVQRPTMRPRKMPDCGLRLSMFILKDRGGEIGDWNNSGRSMPEDDRERARINTGTDEW